jgi:hypothetical protein
MAGLSMTALADAILVIGIALTALLFAFGVRRLLGLLLPEALGETQLNRSLGRFLARLAGMTEGRGR